MPSSGTIPSSELRIQEACLENAVIRANPHYKLISSAKLSPEQREELGLAELTKQRNTAILHSESLPELGIKSLGREGSKLFSACRKPARLYDVLQEPPSSAVLIQIAELILDGVLELEQGANFVSGVRSYKALFQCRPLPRQSGEIAKISIQALKYAQNLEIRELGRLSARLYFYHRLPCNAAWEHVVPPSESTSSFLGLSSGSQLTERWDAGWQRVQNRSQQSEGWIYWRSRKGAKGTNQARAFKLYISPKPEFLKEVIARSFPILGQFRAHTSKVASDLFGLLRPDKFVIYFSNLDDLMGAAEVLRKDLSGIAAHPVPFSAPIGTDGLLSWGIDPPRRRTRSRPHERESWRLWITNRLARYILAAKVNPGDDMEPWEFALRRLHHDGIPLGTWTPSPMLWASS